MVVATGFFDGVHLGHRLVIDSLASAARQRGEESLVITFWPHPQAVLQKEARGIRLLSSLEEKKERILACGVDRVEVIPFTKAFSALRAEEYLRTVLIGRYGATRLILGYDNRLGADRLGPGDIAPLAARLGLAVEVVPAVSVGESVVSSSRIREQLSAGDVETAAVMLGYAYSLRGVVVGGKQLGRTIGFPTANLGLYDPLKLLPALGVYLVRVQQGGRRFWGMCNVADRIETHIFDFNEQIYGLDLGLEFVRRMRDEIRFDSLDALKQQLERDKRNCLEEIRRRGIADE